jgi:hypothetical protein
MPMRCMRFALAPLILLAACHEREGKPGPDISLSDNGQALVTADGKSGAVSVGMAGFKANIRLPRMDRQDFDIDGVKLYPGARISRIDIDTGSAVGGDTVRLAFVAPATPVAVRDYFLAGFKARHAKAVARGDGLEGVTSDGDPFRIGLHTAAGGHASGLISLRSKD